MIHQNILLLLLDDQSLELNEIKDIPKYKKIIYSDETSKFNYKNK